MSRIDALFTENEALRASERELKLDNAELRATVRRLEDRVAELEGQIATATVGVRGAIVPSARHAPTAGEVLPPDQRASWARERTPYDR